MNRLNFAAAIGAMSGLLTLIGGPAHAVTTTITVTGTAITVDCVGSSNPVCQGFTGGGSPNFPTSQGTLSSTNADLYDVQPSNEANEAQALDILIDGLDDDDFVTGTKTDAGGVDTLSFFSSADYISFKVGNDTFFLDLQAPGQIELAFDKNGQRAGGLSHYTEFGSSCTANCDPPTVPEPASLALLGAGLVGLGLVRRRRV